jgi:hypothetical protein
MEYMVFKKGLWVYESPVIKEISRNYAAFLKQKIFKEADNHVTKEQYIKLWMESGKWVLRGKKQGDYTLHIKPGANPVTIVDCSIVQWSHEITWRAPIKALRPESEPIPPKKPRKPKQTPKYYNKSEVQAIRQSMRDLEKQFKNSSPKKENLDEAVANFYEHSTNPLNARILEASKQVRTNYRSHNLVTMGVKKVLHR